jgi:hypothetical protein
MTDRPAISPQAAAMLDRVSPEGRERARRERERRQRATARLAVRCIVAGLLIGLALALSSLWLPIGGAELAGAVALFVLACAGIAFAARERPASARQLQSADLAQLSGMTGRWLEGQRAALPAPAVTLADAIGVRLEAMAPQLAQLPADAPAADSVRKLLAVELPALIDGHRAIPEGLRSQPRANGDSADQHLTRGLTLIDGEIARMTEQLARGAFDEVATQHRYLELKYDGDRPLA